MKVAFFGANVLGQRVLHWLADHRWYPEAMYHDPVTDVPVYDLGISVGYRHILNPTVIGRFRRGIINLHTGFLPYNRGRFPNVWPIIDGTPAGVTLHWIDAGVDTGDIIAQQRVSVEPWDTAETLYHKLEHAGMALFAEAWPSVVDGTAPRTPQQPGGTVHRGSELATLDWLEVTPEVRQALNLIRARTFAGYAGIRYLDGEKVVEATITLRDAHEDRST